MALPIGIYLHAQSFKKSAERLYLIQGDSFQSFELMPIYFLYSHSLETVLKSYLVSQNYTETALKRPPLNHNLADLYNLCKDHGLPKGRSPEEWRTQIIELLNHQHSNHFFRYIKLGAQQLPRLDEVKIVLDETFELIYSFVYQASLNFEHRKTG